MECGSPQTWKRQETPFQSFQKECDLQNGKMINLSCFKTCTHTRKDREKQKGKTRKPEPKHVKWKNPLEDRRLHFQVTLENIFRCADDIHSLFTGAIGFLEAPFLTSESQFSAPTCRTVVLVEGHPNTRPLESHAHVYAHTSQAQS